MATVKRCPNCGPNSDLQTDYSAGNVVCYNCGQIVEEGILVSEVGFAESAGGRVHVQGAFVSNYATGVAGSRGGRGGAPNTENIKAQGASKIENVGRQMHLHSNITRGAKRFFSLAVDNRFNRGRRTEYIIASCLYLQCRLMKDAHMLIDFSERLSINVFELGATYLKLRNILSLLEPMPEVDPAIYNLRFAHRLDFGSSVHSVATDASRLVRRFKADWMTQGRRPAGVCGACLIIAARMSNFLRTPDEVAQVVKVHSSTIKKRLLEFAQTDMAKKTVAEWRSLSDDQLDTPDENEKPPAIKEAERLAIKVEKLKNQNEEDMGDEDDGEGDTPRKRRRIGENGVGVTGVVEAAVHDLGDDVAGEEEEEEEEDDNLEPLPPSDYVHELEGARDNPEEVRAERKREKAALMKQVKALQKGEEIDVDLEALANEGEDLDEEEEEEEVEEIEGVEDEDGDDLAATQLRSVTKQEADGTTSGGNPKTEKFTEWHDESAVLKFFQSKLFSGDELLYKGDHMTNRIKMWWGTRDPKEVMQEMEVVHRARQRRERQARLEAETQFEDLDDDELENYFRLEEDEKQARARMWLSANGRWLEEEKDRQEKRAAYNRAKGIDPSKPKTKRKRAAPQKGPYNTATEAIQSFAKGKQFSSRVNYDVLRSLGLGKTEMAGTEGLVSFDDEKEDEDEEKEDEGEEKEDEYW
ncbi:hypothetical protein CI109_105859 [Kwoniella shandongensis]|uniref:B-related factor 1 n=1 Tax=Kwoniella shandongensis TaxID=1734106 RepID=A0A5M6BY66_9TREE|nr:uncharacterized protein CI109_005706 [Kwoniella shandongensis]KAA5525959.1 hypothetical protein CI109_005706 [Kwoniella shandongensis]